MSGVEVVMEGKDIDRYYSFRNVEMTRDSDTIGDGLLWP